MNRIKSLLGLFFIVLTVTFSTLNAEAQAIAAPPGTSTSVKMLAQIYLETGDHVKKTQQIEGLEIFAEETAVKYADRIDVNTKINDSDRRYITKCFMYSVKQILRCTIKHEGADPDDPLLAPHIKEALDSTEKQLKEKLAKAKNVGECVEATETIYE